MVNYVDTSVGAAEQTRGKCSRLLEELPYSVDPCPILHGEQGPPWCHVVTAHCRILTADNISALNLIGLL